VYGPLGLPLECDLHFAPTRTIGERRQDASAHDRYLSAIRKHSQAAGVAS
jgi:hypothetical protein